MNILLLSRYGFQGASSRLRSLQYLPYLESNGFTIDCLPLLDDQYLLDKYSDNHINYTNLIKSYFNRISFVNRSKRHDIIWIEKELLPWIPDFIEQKLFSHKMRIVVDYDDAIFHRYDQHRNGLIKNLLGRKIDSIMRRAHLVIVGNDYLRSRAKDAGATNIVNLPTVVDLNRYSSSRRGYQGNQITVGWIGSQSTTKNLRIINSVISSMSKNKSLNFVAIGASPDQVNSPDIETRLWSLEKEVEVSKMSLSKEESALIN
jgi:hypothetical protein